MSIGISGVEALISMLRTGGRIARVGTEQALDPAVLRALRQDVIPYVDEVLKSPDLGSILRALVDGHEPVEAVVVPRVGDALRCIALHGDDAVVQTAALAGIGEGTTARALRGLRMVVAEVGEPVDRVEDILLGASGLLSPLASQVQALTARGGVPEIIKLTDPELVAIRAGLADLGFQAGEINQMVRRFLGTSTNKIVITTVPGVPGIGYGPAYPLPDDGMIVPIYEFFEYPSHWHLAEELIVLIRGGLQDHRGIYLTSAAYQQLVGTLHHPLVFGFKPAFFLGFLRKGGVAIVPRRFDFPVGGLVDLCATRSKIPVIFNGIPPKDLESRGHLAGFLTSAFDRHQRRIAEGIGGGDSDPEALLDELIGIQNSTDRVARARQYLKAWFGEAYLKAT